MTVRALTTAQQHVRISALALNLGRCVLGCGEQASNGAHRLPEGQGGPYSHGNLLGLDGSGTTGCHGASESARALSYSTGWLIRTIAMPAIDIPVYIRSIPALITTQLGPGWHFLNHDGTARLADPWEIPTGMFAGTFGEAVKQLRNTP